MSAWGIKPEERRLTFPCDRYVSNFDVVLYRGTTIRAPDSLVFRWLCQMRIAPYSYDKIDNQGRQSPRTLTPGLQNLKVGQTMMGFEIIEFEQDRHVTLQGSSRMFGGGVGSYLIVPITPNECRLLVKIVLKYPRGVRGLLARFLLPWGDLVMMRRQLLNFKELSEESYLAS